MGSRDSSHTQQSQRHDIGPCIETIDVKFLALGESDVFLSPDQLGFPLPERIESRPVRVQGTKQAVPHQRYYGACALDGVALSGQSQGLLSNQRFSVALLQIFFHCFPGGPIHLCGANLAY